MLFEFSFAAGATHGEILNCAAKSGQLMAFEMGKNYASASMISRPMSTSFKSSPGTLTLCDEWPRNPSLIISGALTTA
jgi:hypothetical protein